MKAITDWINSHKVLTVCIAIFLLIVQPFLVHLVLLIPAPYAFMITDLNDGELLTYVAGFEAFLGTVFLGIVAVRQNDKANELNALMQQSNEKHATFERQPSLMITAWDFERVNPEILHSNENTIFSYDVFWGNDKDEDIVLSLLKLKLLNVSRVCAEFEIYAITLELSDRLPRKKVFLYTYNSNYGLFHLLANQEFSLGIVYNKKHMNTCESYEVQIFIAMSNNIGESFIEAIRFNIDNDTLFRLDGYFTKPFNKEDFVTAD